MKLGLFLLCMALALGAPPPALADPVDDVVVRARDALRKKDRAQLAAARQAVLKVQHPLAGWVDYWELLNRLDTAQQPELDAFWARWPETYVEDRLRNDWLLELGRRRDWGNFRVEVPRFRMNDDREVVCYTVLTQHLDGHDVRAAARAAWNAQRDLDEGCAHMASTLYGAGVLTPADVWHKARLAMEASRPRAVRAAAALLGPAVEKSVAEMQDNAARFLARRAPAAPFELELLTLMRLAAVDPEQAAAQLEGGWAARLPPALAATAWAHAGKQGAIKQLPQAAGWAQRAWRLWDAGNAAPPPWSDDLLAWQVRAALRQPASDRERWPLVHRAVEAMSPAEQRDPAWVYWRARAHLALAAPGAEGEADRATARAALASIAQPPGFYNRLAAEELGGPPEPGAPPAPLSTAEMERPRAQPGFQRALRLIDLGLRNEGVREWNYTLRGLSNSELLAAALWACQREVWDRCINTSERAHALPDLALRYPLPWREQVGAAASGAGLDLAVVYGLIRQESRFIMDARSSVGASGLMQLMPATARWTARKIGMDFHPSAIADRDTNLRLGTAYLRRVLDDFDGSLPMAAAAYNAGPNRVRRWRDAAPTEAAAWVENIPFNETRDYVKKVLANAAEYALRMGRSPPALKAWLGPPIGPRSTAAPAPDGDIP